MRKSEFYVDLNSIEKVKDFINITTNYKGKILVRSGEYVVDGKSLMGIFSIDISNKVIVEISYDKESEINDLLNKLLDAGITLVSI